GVCEPRQGRALDRRQSRGPRRRRHGVPAPQPRRPGALEPGLDGGQGQLSDRAFWSRFLLPGGLWLLLLFAVPICLVLALSFGYTDDLGRAVYSNTLANYTDAFDPLYIPVLLRSIGYALATA